MPREIVHISIGQCGNQIGYIFWKRILEEHNIGVDGYFRMHNNLQYEDYFKLDKISVYFDETKDKNLEKYVPRTILIDLEPGVISTIFSSSPIGKLFHPDYVLSRASGAGNNWAKGHYTLGSECIDETMDIVRKQVENCDLLQGFQLTHSIGGGTGSGFGTLILEKLKDNYPDRINSTFSIYPTPRVSDIVVEPYNAILSLAHIITDSDCSFVIDNEALFNISDRVLKLKKPSFSDLNWIISLVMGGVTSSLRFPGILNCDLRKMSVNLIPFPRLHFFSSSYSPLLRRSSSIYNKTEWNISKISSNLWSTKNLLTSIQKKTGKALTSTVMYRGKNISSSEVEQVTSDFLNLKSDRFVEWIPNNIKTAIITLKPLNIETEATMIGNITSVKDIFERIWQSFNKLFTKKAFLHWYKSEGMHEMEFVDAEKQVKDLIMEYFEKQEVDIDWDNVYNNWNINDDDDCDVDIDDILDDDNASVSVSVSVNIDDILNNDDEKKDKDKCNTTRNDNTNIIDQYNDPRMNNDNSNSNSNSNNNNNNQQQIDNFQIATSLPINKQLQQQQSSPSNSGSKNYDLSHDDPIEQLGDDLDDYDDDFNNGGLDDLNDDLAVKWE